MSTNAYSYQCHQYSPASVDRSPNLSALPTFPSEKSEERPVTTSSRSFRRLAGTRGASKGPYSCNICGKMYAQPQGVTRHHREAHQVSVCMYCGEFNWGRLYQFKRHLKVKHPNVDHMMLGGSTESRREVTRIRKQSPRQRVSPFILEQTEGVVLNTACIDWRLPLPQCWKIRLSPCQPCHLWTTIVRSPSMLSRHKRMDIPAN